MSKKNLHPEYHIVVVKMTNGKEFKTKSCFGKENSIITLDIDPYNHPAWKDGKQAFVNVNDNQITKFNKKFNNFSFETK